MRRIRKLLGLGACALGLTATGRAQSPDALNLPAPLLQAMRGLAPGGAASDLTAAQRAQDLGLPSIAIDLYREARERPGADRVSLTLALSTALLDAGRATEAEQVLAEIPEPRSAGWHLRAGLAAVQLKKTEAARAELAAIREPEVSVEDYPWYWYFQGTLVDLAPTPETSRANDFYHRAENAAMTPLSKARFQLAEERHRLRRKEVTGADLKSARDNYQQLAGTPMSYEFAEVVAMSLSALGQQREAETFLQDVIVRLPRQESVLWDRFRLILGMVGDRSRTGAGRAALVQLVESGNFPERQSQALELLAGDSRTGPERDAFRALLDRLIDVKPDHPIKENLLLVRAEAALAEKDFIRAELDANVLATQFPLSRLKAYAWGVLTQSAWEQQRFRPAASFAARTRDELPVVDGATNPVTAISARARTRLRILEAEAHFRAGLAGDRSEFRFAADAYAATLREKPVGLEPDQIGDLLLQRALAEIKSGSPDAGKVIDDLAREPAFDLARRWRAEWTLARELPMHGEAGVKEAFARVKTLLAESSPAAVAIDPELRARMEWLQVQLAFNNGDYDQTIGLADALLGAPRAVEPWLKTEIASTTILLKARGQFALDRESDALKTLALLRSDYSKTDAAIKSYLLEAEHYERQEKIDEARKRLISLTDNDDYKNSRYLPWALYRLAELSERLGRDENLKEANQRIEDALEWMGKRGEPGGDELYFAARLKQGDIFRKRNDFPGAIRAYEELVNKYPRRPDVVYAQLELAECHNALSSSDPKDSSHAETAKRQFEQLRDRVDAPLDVRVEAGYNLGKLLERGGKLDEAAKAWWQDLIQRKEILFERDAKTFETGAKRPYWVARILRELGELQEKRGRTDEAIAAYRLILDMNLVPGQAVARSRLQQLAALPAKASP